MGRGRGKGKKHNVVASHEDLGSGEEEKVSAYRRRGRPAKQLKEDNEVEESEKKEETDNKTEENEENGDDTKDSISSKEVKSQATTENGRKRKRVGNTKENTDSVKEKNIGKKMIADDSPKTFGFRQSGNRRKSKPRRAAEAVVECW